MPRLAQEHETLIDATFIDAPSRVAVAVNNNALSCEVTREDPGSTLTICMSSHVVAFACGGPLANVVETPSGDGHVGCEGGCG
jgi:hypothetical protein